ncbi:DUF4157 domain-containing protein [bacterium]|nr:DUF4157 domain-containing protein [bacterium]
MPTPIHLTQTAPTNRKRSASAAHRPGHPDPQRVIQRARSAPHSVTHQDILVLQRSIGNQATVKLLQPMIQAKMTLGPANDTYEHEADHVADQVVRTMDNNSATGAPGIQRMGEEEEMLQGKRIQRMGEEEEMLQGKQMHGPEGGEVDETVQQSIQSARGSGRPLDDGVRTSMEQGFGADFSQVRVHTGPQADALNRSLNAKAFTTGGDIFFGQGQYQPDNTSGQKLLAHELTHTVQQGAASTSVSRKTTFGDIDTSLPAQRIHRVVRSRKKISFRAL